MAGAETSAAIRNAATTLNNSYAKKSTGGESLGKNDFLKLMMAQATHQDPLNPMDSQGMMNQLTAMGSLEQLININKNMDALNQTQSDIARANAFSFLDKDVTAHGGAVKVSTGAPPGMQYVIPREAGLVKVSIVDKGGNTVRTLDLGAQGPGRHTVEWDAVNDKGDRVPEGSYRYSVTAESADKEPIPVNLYMRGKVSGVRLDKGRYLLKVNGEEIDVKNVIELSNRSQRLFGSKAPQPLRQELQPRPPVLNRRH